jgi:hypothetical protein
MARIMFFRHCPTLLSDAPGVVVALTPHRRRPAWTPGALRGWSRLGLDQTHSLEARTYLFFRWIGAQGMQRGPRASGYSDRPEGRNGVNLEAHGKSCPRGAVVSRSGSDLFSSLFRPAGHPPTRRNLAREHPDRPRPARPRVASRRAPGGRQGRIRPAARQSPPMGRSKATQRISARFLNDPSPDPPLAGHPVRPDRGEAVGSDGRRVGWSRPRIVRRRLESVPAPFDRPCQVTSEELQEEVERAYHAHRQRVAAHHPAQDRTD